MKKIKSILLVLSFLIFDKLHSQDIKVAFDTTNNVKYHSLRMYISVLPGFQVIKKDSALVSVASPVGINYRQYSKKNINLFWDLDFSAMPIILNQNHLTSFSKLAGGIGFVRSQYNMQLHGSFAVDFANHKTMFGAGYDVEAQSIPITVDLLKFINTHGYLLLIGIKIPIIDSRY